MGEKVSVVSKAEAQSESDREANSIQGGRFGEIGLKSVEILMSASVLSWVGLGGSAGGQEAKFTNQL